MRWGLLQPKSKYCDCAWKKLYLQVVSIEFLYVLVNLADPVIELHVPRIISVNIAMLRFQFQKGRSCMREQPLSVSSTVLDDLHIPVDPQCLFIFTFDLELV